MEFIEHLFELDFRKKDFVHEPGEFSSRGNILDIFSFSNTDPIRIEFDMIWIRKKLSIGQ